MSAILIAEILEVRDEKLYTEYRARVDTTVSAAGGKYLARSAEIDVLEGHWRPRRLVVVQFESAEKARSWWAGGDYHDLKAMRQQATRTNMVIVEGARGASPS